MQNRGRLATSTKRMPPKTWATVKKISWFLSHRDTSINDTSFDVGMNKINNAINILISMPYYRLKIVPNITTQVLLIINADWDQYITKKY